MDFAQNLPFFSIVLTMFGGIVSFLLNGKWAKRFCMLIISLVIIMSAILLAYTSSTGESFTYMMGHFPAPWGNELRAGILEALMATVFAVIMLFCVLGGSSDTTRDVEPKKLNLYYLLLNLILSSVLALIYTNDVFTAYVFVEINTLAACGLMVIRQKGHTIVAAIRYMIMSAMGSGLFLMGLTLLYDMTGHLAMSFIKEEVTEIYQSGQYHMPMNITIGLICVGLAIKSALFPFHFWVPDTYGYSTSTTAAVLSGIVSKGYIFLLIKIIYRTIGIDVMNESGMLDILFVLGVAGMIGGSLGAIKERDLRRMIAFSSVAQIGYIYMGIGTGITVGAVAALFHMLVHASSKSALFISGRGLIGVSSDSKKFNDLTGAGYRHKFAGFAFTAACLSMVGIPAFAGFMSKILFASAAITSGNALWVTLAVLTLSTILNAIYFLKTLIRIYTKDGGYVLSPSGKPDMSIGYLVSLVAMVAGNMYIGLQSQPLINYIEYGLSILG